MIPKIQQLENNLKNKIDKNIVPIMVDLNTLTTTGFYYCNSDSTNLPVSNTAFYLTVIATGNSYCSQIAIEVGSTTSSVKQYKRELYDGTWTSWISQYEEFGNWGNTEALMDYTGDLNDLTKSGWYPTPSSNANLPTADAYLVLVLNKNPDYYVKQIAFQREGEGIFYRRRISPTSWTEWNALSPLNCFLPVNQDFNYVIQPGTYWFGNGSAPTGDNKPTSETGFLEVISNSNSSLVMQRYTTYTGRVVYQRGFYSNTWHSWTVENQREIGTIPSNGNFNNYKTEGRWKYGAQTTILNRPSTAWGILEVIVCLNYIMQRVSGEAGVQLRMSYDSGATWGEWKTV